MESQSESNDDLTAAREMRRRLQARTESSAATQQEILVSLQAIVPDIVFCINLSLKVVSAFNGRPFTPISLPNPSPIRNLKRHIHPSHSPTPQSRSRRGSMESSPSLARQSDTEKFTFDESGSPLSIVRSMVAVCLLERVPFSPIESSIVLQKLETDESATPAEKAALRDLGGESGAIIAVEMALRSMAEDNGGVELEEFVVSGKSRVNVLGINRIRLVRELPESVQYQRNQESSVGLNSVNGGGGNPNSGVLGSGGMVPRHIQDIWLGSSGHHLGCVPPFFSGHGSIVGPRGGPGVVGLMGMSRGMCLPPIQRPVMNDMVPSKIRTEEDDMKDIEALLHKKSFREMQKSKTGEELLDLIHRPTAKETAVAAKFKTKGGSQLKEYCSALTKEDCRRQSGFYIACEKVHFRRIIALHTDTNLGDCSFLDTCRHMKTCKYVHYELDPTPDMSPMLLSNALTPPKQMKSRRAEYCSEVELGEPQWINCDIRSFRMDILGQFGVIMADPPWDIHMELPYGTMADDEMRTLNVPALQTNGLIFLWVTGRAMELGRECLELWGYQRIEELIWVKTNQLQRIIRTGRTGHWLNHSKEHCLVGIKGNPEVNRNIDTDVIVAEVRETSRKPDEMYPMLERISPRTRKLELFARMHNTHAGWLSLGNQLQGVRLVDEGLRARFKAAYSDMEVQPLSPPRPTPTPPPPPPVIVAPTPTNEVVMVVEEPLNFEPNSGVAPLPDVFMDEDGDKPPLPDSAELLLIS